MDEELYEKILEELRKIKKKKRKKEEDKDGVIAPSVEIVGSY